MKLVSSFFVLLLSACAGVPTLEERRLTATALASERGWQGELIAGPPFVLAAFVPRHITPAQTLTIYLEGDGHAWQSSRSPSTDPSPIDPLALRLALAQPLGNAAYLARPCQYVLSITSSCASRYWMGARFAPEVIAGTSQAIDVLKTRFGADRLTLVGYSGGGAVAALLAQRRTDVERLVTVAGNVNPTAWTDFHHVTPLRESLDPMQARASLGQISQWHFVGSRDAVVPPKLITAFTAGMPKAKTITLEGYSHTCCWADNWPRLWASIQ
jgi:pimeloyl-ACP methyl ester carboxylesterase